jgi:hypothetical protein
MLIFMGIPVALFYRIAHRFEKEYAPVAATLPAELAAARKEGLPTIPEALRPDPPVSDAENAAPLYRSLNAIYKQRGKAEQDADGLFVSSVLKKTSRTEADRQAMRDFLNRHAEELKIAEQAGAKPRCDFAHDWNLGMETRFAEGPLLRDAARLLAVHALLCSDENQPVPALHDIALGAQIGRHAASDPTIIAALVGSAIEAIMHRQFVAILQRHGANPDILPAAKATLGAFSGRIDFRHAFAGELVLSLVTFEQIRRSPGFAAEMRRRGIRLPPPSNPQVKEQMTDAWKSRIIDYWRRVQSSLSASRGDLVSFESALQQIQSEEDTRRLAAGYEMNALLVSVFVKLPARGMQQAANGHLRSRLVALHEYHGEHRVFPLSLAALPPSADNQDPFTNQPLLYRRIGSGNGFILYSAGNNRKDDGGSTKITKVDDTNWPEDIAVSYP